MPSSYPTTSMGVPSGVTMATPTAASPRGVRRPVVCFFLFQAQASASGPSFVRLFYSPFFYSGGLRPDTKQVTVYNSVQTKIPRGIFSGRVREVVLWRTRRCFSFWIVTCNVHQGVITKRDAQTTTVLSIQADSLLIPCQQAAQIQAMLFGFERQ